MNERASVLPLGLIEGFYGRPWEPAARACVLETLGAYGFSFYVYAPKADTALRRCWREPMADARMAELAALGQYCRAQRLRFGVGLTPFEFDAAPGSPDWAHLAQALARLDAGCAPDEVALLFDDMRGDDPHLASTQAAVVAFAAERTRARYITMCPSYYSDDPILDAVFGTRPKDYLTQLGRQLDPQIRVFWTGEEVCSREYAPAHLARVADELRRAPVLWDNYPVNDGPRMAQALHVRAMTGRPASNAPWLAGHAVNPALQARLGCIPLLTLAERYRVGDGAYAYGTAWLRAAHAVIDDPSLVAALRADWIALQDTGLDRLGPRRAVLRARYAAFDHPVALEVVQWLDGFWNTTEELVQTQ
jgi:hyaluronoglucosaminidase